MGGGGGKSSSSTDQAQTTLSADGVVTGKVFNVSSKGNANLTYVDQFPEEVANIMSQLIDQSSKTIERAFGAGERALTAGIQSAQQASQPDLTVLKESFKYVPLLVIGLVGVVAAVVWRK